MIILSSKFGQLANRLFLFSHLLKVCYQNNISFYNPSFDEYAPFFEGSTNGLMIKDKKIKHFFDTNTALRGSAYYLIRAFSMILPKTPFINIFFQKIFLKNDDAFSLDSPENIKFLMSKKITFLSGWLFRSNDIEPACHKFIKDYFTPQKEHVENVKKIIEPIKKNYNTIIGIHIRRGDYQTYCDGIYFYAIEDYFKLMLKLADIFGKENTAFLICSNEEINIKIFGNLNVFKSTEHFVEDLYSLSECDYIAGPPSTYSMWASYYGDKPLYMINDINQMPEKESFQITLL
jgi:hypothetical protein